MQPTEKAQSITLTEGGKPVVLLIPFMLLHIQGFVANLNCQLC